MTLLKAGLKNGDVLHVGNQDVELQSVKEAVATKAQETKEESKGAQNEEMIDTSKPTQASVSNPGKKPMTDEEYQKSKCRHGPN